ncbi:MAG: phosphopantetheine-binding protein [Gemmatimonadales bacterium]
MSEESPEPRVARVVQRLLVERSLSPTIQPDEDLRVAGLTSLDMISLVLAVEAEFGLLVPETHIKPDNFQSVAAISGLVTALLNVG